MIFNSLTFLIYLPIVVILYWLLPRMARMWMIAIMSLVFYGFWKPQYTLLLIFAAILDYYVALAIDKREDPRSRKNLLVLSLIINIGILVYFKYLIFFKDNFESLLNSLGAHAAIMPHLQILLPIGISFYTFETISYTVDVYRKHLKPEKDFISYLSFLVYFPHLIAGPVLRAADILPQFDKKTKFNWDHIISGFKRIIIGLFLKVVIADNIAPLVDEGYAMQTTLLSAIDVWTLAFLFGFQIYFDFCAYSHIAIGCARMMGITFFENFNFPYMATSPKAFWKRWHISLSNWIKDYLYLPLTGKKVSYDQQEAISEIRSSNTLKGYTALFLTWAIMGFWHGANWTFIIWGLYHATLVTCHRIISRHTKSINAPARNFLGWCISLPFLMLGWIPFRVAELTTVKDYFGKVFNPFAYTWMGLKENVYLITFIVMLLIIITYLFTTYIRPKLQETYIGQLVDISALSGAIALVIVFLRPVSQFIYFQF
jgi:alginate O-acetyltransferase complex protein AlgI